MKITNIGNTKAYLREERAAGVSAMLLLTRDHVVLLKDLTEAYLTQYCKLKPGSMVLGLPTDRRNWTVNSAPVEGIQGERVVDGFMCAYFIILHYK